MQKIDQQVFSRTITALLRNQSTFSKQGNYEHVKNISSLETKTVKNTTRLRCVLSSKVDVLIKNCSYDFQGHIDRQQNRVWQKMVALL